MATESAKCADEDTDLFYYNAQTKQTWLLTSVSLREDDTLGSVTDFKVSLFKSCELSAKLGASVPFTPAANDLLAVFADDVCCGVGTYDAEKKEWSVKAYNLSPTTTEAHFRYYSAEKQQIFKTPVMFDFKSIQRTILTPYYLNFK